MKLRAPHSTTPSKPSGKKVFVGLSGGVDSAVSAALLQREGYDVTGVFLRTWHPEGFPCSEGEDERDAMRVAAYLGIPFKTLDLSLQYKTTVAQVMIDGYASGETPNPDVLCNKQVKFGGFLEYALKEGADYIATGHYAQVEHTEEGTRLLKGEDPSKDQSYFLSLVPNRQLSHVLFPVGGMQKSAVRTQAERFGLPNAIRKDSQGICFLGAVDLEQFLKEFIPLKSGAVLSQKGETIGEHRGAPLYTVGERHGFSVRARSSVAEPLYIVSTDITANTVTVAPKQKETGRKVITLRDAELHNQTLDGSLVAQVRYHGTLYPCTVEKIGQNLRITFAEPILVADGQTVCLYRDTLVVAAGIVTRSN